MMGYSDWSQYTTIKAVSAPSQVDAPIVSGQSEGQMSFTTSFSYVGCYNDDADRAINDSYVGFEQTVESCAE